MIGKIGENAEIALGAVGAGNQVFFILNMVIFGITSGGSVFIAQFWGKQDIKGIRKTLGLSLVLCLIFAAAFTLFALFLPQVLIGIYSRNDQVIAEGVKYLRIVAYSYPLMAISFAFQMAFRSTEHIVLPTVCTAVSFVLNAVLNYVFIFVLGMGVAGAAAATLISRAVELVICIIASYSLKFEACGGIEEYLSFTMKFVLKLGAVALPVVLSETCWGLGISLQTAIFGKVSNEYFDSFSIANTVSQLTWVFFIGTGSAAGIIIGKKIGAGEIDGAKAYASRFSWFMPCCGLFFGMLLYPFSFLLKFLFNVDEIIISDAQKLLYVLVGTYAFRAYNMLSIVGIFRAGGDTLYASVIDNIFMWAIALPLGYVCAVYFGFKPWQILLCLETEQVFKALFGFVRIKSGKWIRDVTK